MRSVTVELLILEPDADLLVEALRNPAPQWTPETEWVAKRIASNVEALLVEGRKKRDKEREKEAVRSGRVRLTIKERPDQTPKK